MEKYLNGKVRDSQNLIRDCTKKGICEPRQMNFELLKAELFLCKKKMEQLKATALADRRVHLQRRLKVHCDAGHKKAVKVVIRIMKKEANEKRFRRMCWTTKPPDQVAQSTMCVYNRTATQWRSARKMGFLIT